MSARHRRLLIAVAVASHRGRKPPLETSAAGQSGTDQVHTEFTFNKGLVRATRLTDAKSVDVPAGHHTVVSFKVQDELIASEVGKATNS